MAGTDTFVQLATDGSGKMVRAFSNLIGGNTVYQQIATLFDKDGNEIAVPLGSTDTLGLRGILARTMPHNESRVLTQAALGANAVYTSPWFDLNELGAAHIWWAMVSNVATATNGVAVEFSPDNGANIMAGPTHTYNSTDPGLGSWMFRDSVPRMRYWRIKVTNGGTAQTSFLLTVTFFQTLTTSHDSVGRAVIQGDMIDGVATSYFTGNNSGKLPTLPVRVLSDLATWGADSVIPLHSDTKGRLMTISTHPAPPAPVTANGSAAGTSIIAAPGAGVSLYICKGSIHNRNAAAQVVSLRDGAAGTIRWTAELAADGGGSMFDFGERGWKLTANTALILDTSAGPVDVNVTLYYTGA